MSLLTCLSGSVHSESLDLSLGSESSRGGVCQKLGPICFFSFDEPLLDAESVLEDVLDTNMTSFLRRF